jgi:hypothetical protein
LDAFGQWRHTRPFWGALFVIVGGAEILLTEAASVPLVVHIGLQGVAGYLIPIVLLITGLLLLFHPVQRTFYSLIAILLALGCWITSNLGGFLIGMLAGVIGGSLAFAWQPPHQPQQEERRSKPLPSRQTSGGIQVFESGDNSAQQSQEAQQAQEAQPAQPTQDEPSAAETSNIGLTDRESPEPEPEK